MASRRVPRMGVHQSAPLTYPAGQLPTFLTGSGSAIAAIVDARRMRTPPSGGAIPLTAPPPTHRRHMCAGEASLHAPSIPDPSKPSTLHKSAPPASLDHSQAYPHQTMSGIPRAGPVGNIHRNRGGRLRPVVHGPAMERPVRLVLAGLGKPSVPRRGKLAREAA